MSQRIIRIMMLALAVSMAFVVFPSAYAAYNDGFASDFERRHDLLTPTGGEPNRLTRLARRRRIKHSP